MILSVASLAILYAARRLTDAAARLDAIQAEPVHEADGYDLGEAS